MRRREPHFLGAGFKLGQSPGKRDVQGIAFRNRLVAGCRQILGRGLQPRGAGLQRRNIRKGRVALCDQLLTGGGLIGGIGAQVVDGSLCRVALGLKPVAQRLKLGQGRAGRIAFA